MEAFRRDYLREAEALSKINKNKKITCNYNLL